MPQTPPKLNSQFLTQNLTVAAGCKPNSVSGVNYSECRGVMLESKLPAYLVILTWKSVLLLERLAPAYDLAVTAVRC